MNFKKCMSGNTATMAVSGKLDSVGAPEFDKAVVGLADGVDGVVLDFKEVSYMSSAGLRSVLKLVMGCNGKAKVSIVNADGITAEVFKTAGFGNLLQ